VAISLRKLSEKLSGHYLDLICDESLTYHGLNLNPGYFDDFTFIFVLCGEYRLLVSWCAGGRCDMTGNDEDRGRSRRPGAEDQRYSVTCRVLGGWTIRRSDDVVCNLHHARGDEEHMFLG
jgi:hypothetical protein